MRIVYLTASFPFGKGESFIIPEIEELALNGIKIELLPFIIRGKLNYIPKYKNIIISEFRNNYIFGVLNLFKVIFLNYAVAREIFFILIKSSYKTLFKNIFILPIAVQLAIYLKKRNPDHLHIQWGGTTSTAGLIIGLLTKISWSITCHRWDIYENNLLSLKSKYSSFIRFISIKGMIDAVNFGVKPNKSFVIPMGVSFQKNEINVTPFKSGDIFNIVCPANLIDVKGHIYLFESINYLVKNSFRVKLYVAGDGYLMKSLVKYVNEHSLNENIVFLGNLRQSELFDLYINKNIHCVILPSLDLGGGLHEGIPVSLIEGISFKKLVISTKTGSIPELLDDSLSLTVKDKSSAELTEKIVQFYTKPDLYFKTCNKLFDTIRHKFSVSNTAKLLVNKFEYYTPDES